MQIISNMWVLHAKSEMFNNTKMQMLLSKVRINIHFYFQINVVKTTTCKLLCNLFK
jgi:hypothetical protein